MSLVSSNQQTMNPFPVHFIGNGISLNCHSN